MKEVPKQEMRERMAAFSVSVIYLTVITDYSSVLVE